MEEIKACISVCYQFIQDYNSTLLLIFGIEDW